MKPKKIYYEPGITNYALGQRLLAKYQDLPQIPIASHNHIPELRQKENKDFIELKKYLIIGTRKTHRYTENHKVSDYLVPYTSSGCSAMCLYCYLVCHYNKCSYLRLYVNVEDMLQRLLRNSYKEKDKIFEIGSNSDLILENEITGNLSLTIEEFARFGHGKITFPTKFSMVEPLLSLDHKGKCIFRMSINPQELIQTVEIGTASLAKRIEAVNQMCEAGYPVGIIIAPVILVPDWQTLYQNMLTELQETLSEQAKENLFFEVILMTYSYVHKAINEQAFPEALQLYNQELMTGRGRGKYWYREQYRAEADAFFRLALGGRFRHAPIVYIV